MKTFLKTGVYIYITLLLSLLMRYVTQEVFIYLNPIFQRSVRFLYNYLTPFTPKRGLR